MDDLITLAKQAAEAHGLDPKLVCAVCEQESGWDIWAGRYEPAFQKKYVDPLGLNPTESAKRSFSYGLMQVMGQVAREEGYKGNLFGLLNPTTALEYGCRVLKAKLARAGGDPTKGLLLYNGGGNPDYPKQVLARVDKY